MIRFHTVKPGDVLYAVYRQKMGNTTMSQTVSKAITIAAVDERGATGVSNGYSRHYSIVQVERLRRSPARPRGSR